MTRGDPVSRVPPAGKLWNAADLRQAIHGTYFQEGRKVASSRTTPASYPDVPLGAWKIDDWSGLYGHGVEELVELDPRAVDPGEFEWGAVDSPQGLLPGRYEDAERYAEWIREGVSPPPPISIVEVARTHRLRVTDGHRRLLAADRAARPVRAWVSWSVPHPEGIGDSSGRPIEVGLTFELARPDEAPPRPNPDAQALKRRLMR